MHTENQGINDSGLIRSARNGNL